MERDRALTCWVAVRKLDVLFARRGASPAALVRARFRVVVWRRRLVDDVARAVVDCFRLLRSVWSRLGRDDLGFRAYSFTFFC